VTLVWRPDALTVITAEVAVRPVVVALVTNALDAVSAGGSILVEAISGPRSGLAVSDDGPGCDDLTAAAGGEIARNGSVHLGLGLQIAATILAERGGELAISANVPRGFRAEATWPTP
jgi:phosphoglycerate-specific signal transduction histidine kinase